MLKIFNTLTNKKEIFKPISKKRVNMFVCGITPYDSPHLGHAKVFVNMDFAAKYIRYKKYKLFYLQNVTDIDDKIINRANEKNIAPNKLVDIYFSEFLEMMKALNIKSVSKYAYATDYIPQIIKQVKILIKKGFAYESGGSVYFEVSKFKNYGKLSRQNLKKLHGSQRPEEDGDKKHSYDFVLWKAKKGNEPFWNSPWGPGRPGWHIEDTAISEKFFGPQYDLHGGANELKFPHHEAEIAQQEAASGKKPFVKYWVHTGVLMVNGQKMSKSLGNFVTIKEALIKYSPEILRFMILSSHYRSPIDYNEKILGQAAASLNRLSELISRLKTTKSISSAIEKQQTKLNFKKDIQKFFTALDDDFDTPKALATVFNIVKRANAFMDKNNPTKKEKEEILNFFKEFNKIFAVLPKKEKVPQKIMQLAKEREKYRQEKNWARADEIRNQTENLGYKIEDSPSGPIIKKIQ